MTLPIVSVFSSIRNPNPTAQSPLRDCCAAIQQGHYADLIAWYRALPAEVQADAKSDSIPCFTPSGAFTTRGNANLTAHSGVIVLDLDDVQDVAALRDRAYAIAHTLFAFISPSGRGVKVLVAVTPTPADADQHRLAYDVVVGIYATELNVEIDVAADVARYAYSATTWMRGICAWMLCR